MSLNGPTTQAKYEAALARLDDSLTRVIGWVQRHRYRGYEPADGNASVLFHLTGGRVWPMRIVQQLVLRSPVNVRPLIGLHPHESAIGRGYMAWGYVILCRQGASQAIRDEATSCLAWLIEHRAAGHAECCWGDPYHYATRSGRRPLGAPLLIWTALIGQAFLEAYEVLGESTYLDVARSAGRWIASLPTERTSTGCCLSYNAYKQESIHNSNAMGAAFLARLAAATDHPEMMALSREAMIYTIARQRPDGAWFYGEEPKYHWVDNFHTGYNLSALKVYRDSTGDRSVDPVLNRGLAFFKSHFIEPDGLPRYFHDRAYPVDIQCAAQTIDTLAALAAEHPVALPLALKVAEWTIAHLQSGDGHFRYRRLKRVTVNTPMLHWGQGTMVKALATLVGAIRQHSQRAATA